MVAHAQASHWDELAALAKNKKNPIGFEVSFDIFNRLNPSYKTNHNNLEPYSVIEQCHQKCITDAYLYWLFFFVCVCVET